MTGAVERFTAHFHGKTEGWTPIGMTQNRGVHAPLHLRDNQRAVMELWYHVFTPSSLFHSRQRNNVDAP
jgi:hypothetical protein